MEGVAFLALLGYVSRAYEIEIRPASVASIFSEILAWFSFKYFSFLLTWDPMGAKFQNATPPTNRS